MKPDATVSDDLTAVEKLAVSMTDKRISDAIGQEAETILQLIVHDQCHRIAEHVGSIKSWSGMLAGRAARMPVTPAPQPQPEIKAEPDRQAGQGFECTWDDGEYAIRWDDGKWLHAFASGKVVVTDVANKGVKSHTIASLLATPPVVDEAARAEPIHQQFRLEWDAAPRPPAHPHVMHGQHTFPSFETAVSFMQQQPSDSAFVSLVQIDSYETNRSDELRSALSTGDAS